MTLTTPALLFPAISLLLLAYTNRFLVLAQLIRQLHGQDRHFLSDQIVVGEWVFGLSLVLLTVSLLLSFWEIQISCVAINIELQDLRRGE